MASPDSRQTTALESTTSNAASSGSLAGPSRRSFWKAVLAGFLVTLAVWGLVRMFRRSDMEPLTRDGWQRARQSWNQRGPKDYRLVVRTTGRQASTYEVEVRDGQAVRATRNGQPLPQRRVWHTWTVPGMFETLERDLEQMERSRRNEPGSISLVVYVAFDPTYGYPARYLRSEASAAGANPDVTWEVIEFELLDGSTR